MARSPADIPDGVKADVALRCKGESMKPTLNDGDIVLVKQQPDVLDGQIGVVLIENEATLKHVYHHKDGLLLTADNPSFAPLSVPCDENDDCLIQGLAIGYIRMF